MKLRVNTLAILIAVLALFFHTSAALAIPSLPSSHYGKVTLDGVSVEGKTVVEALIDGVVVAQTETIINEGEAYYLINVPGDDTDTTAKDGGVEGDVITFRIDGITAEQTGTWHTGTNVALDLSALSGSSVTSAQSAAPIPVTGSPEKEQSSLLLITVIGLVMVLLVIAAILIFRKKHVLQGK